MGFSVSYIYNLKDKFSKPSETINRSLKKFKVSLKKAGKAAKGTFSKGLEKARSSITRFSSSIGGAILGAAGMGIGLTGAVIAASNFEDAMSDVNKVMDLSQKGTFKKFRKTILDLAPDLATMPEDLAKMAYQGAKVGVTEAAMKKFLIVVTKTKSAFDMTAEAAGAVIGDIKAKLNLSMTATEKLMSRVNYMADTTSASGTRMLDIIARVSGDFALMKFNTAEIAAFAGAADQIETSSELAASGLRMAFSRLQQSPIYRRDFQKTPVNTFLKVLETLKKMEPVARNLQIKKLFGDEAGKFIKKAVVNISKFRDGLKKASSDQAIKSMDKEWQAFLGRSSTGFMQIKVKLMKLVIRVGGIVLKWFDKNKKAINGVIDSFSNWIESNKEILPVLVAVFVGGTALIGVILMLGAVFASLSVIVGVFGSTTLIAFLPIIAIVLAVVGVLYILYKVWSTITGKTSKTVENMTESVKKMTKAQAQIGSGTYVGKGVTNTYKAEMMKREQTNISGDIRVSAEPGSKVVNKKITANQGYNTELMATDFG